MPTSDRIGQIDFQRHPYRGILLEVAQELNVSRPSVSKRVKDRDPKVIELVLAKIESRERLVQRFERKVSGVAA